MMNLFRTAAAALVLFASSALSKEPPAEWRGLVQTPSTRFDSLYLAPDATFSGYSKVMLDPMEAAFDADWQRDFNQTTIGLQDRITDEEAREILDAMRAGLQEAFTEAYAKAGYDIVSAPGPDVLRLAVRLEDLEVRAPDQMIPARNSTFSEDAGEATLILELRDSTSGALLGGGMDRRLIDDNITFLERRTSVSNRADFERTFRSWARMSIAALSRLRHGS